MSPRLIVVTFACLIAAFAGGFGATVLAMREAALRGHLIVLNPGALR